MRNSHFSEAKNLIYPEKPYINLKHRTVDKSISIKNIHDIEKEKPGKCMNF